jgi:hypothetical protein
MTHRTRYFLIGSGLILVVGLCTGLVAYYNGNLPLRRSAVPAEFSYITSDVTAVAYADVRHIMDSEFRQRLRDHLPAGQEKERLLAETGIDLERDIDTVVAGFMPDAGPGGSVVLVRGRFDASKIESVATQHGATVEEYSGKRLLRSAGSAETPGIAFLEPNLLALGNIDAIRRAIDASRTQQTISSNAELMEAVNGVVNTGNAWVVGRPNAMLSANLPDQVKDQLASLQWFALSAGVDRGLNCRLRAEARDAASAEQMRAVVNGALALARLMDKDKRLDAFDAVQATGRGAQIDLSFTVPPEVLDAISPATRFNSTSQKN